MNKYKLLLLTYALIVAVFVLRGCGRNPSRKVRVDPNPEAVLPANDAERITYDAKTKKLVLQSQTGTTTEYAKNPVIEIKKDGSISVFRHLAGFEMEPFIGGGYADTARLFVGVNSFHFSRFDLDGSCGFSFNHQYLAVKTYIGVGYNFYNNTSVNLAVNPLSVLQAKGIEIGGFVSVRL